MTDTEQLHDPMPDHEHEGEARRGRLVHRTDDGPATGARKLGRRVASLLLPRKLAGVCAVSGISLTNYSTGPSRKGWGAHCTGGHTTITLKNGVRVTVRSEIATLATTILNECLRRGYVIRQADTGSYNCRLIAGSSTWSNHAWALAIDVNWRSNPYTSGTQHDIPDWMAKLFNRYGFAWGGDYTGSRRDYMHFEFMGTPAQAAVATTLALRELTGNPPPPPPPPGGKLPVYTTGSRVLELRTPHMTGTDVQKLQDVLNKWYPALPQLAEDGDYGAGTADRVKYFQGKASLTADGVCGPRTWAALGY